MEPKKVVLSSEYGTSGNFKVGLIEADMSPLKPGELFLPYAPRIGPSKLGPGIFFDQMIAYATYRNKNRRQYDLKSMKFEEGYVMRIGNKIMKRMLTCSITEKIEDNIEMIMYRIYGVRYIESLKHPEHLYSLFSNFHRTTTHSYRGGY